MALSEIQQACKVLDRATNVLLIVPAKASLDALASMIALYLTFAPDDERNADSIIDEVSASHVPMALQFLSGSSQIKTEPTQQPEVVIDMIGPQAITNIHQKQLVGGRRIYISFPPNTTVSKENLETSVRVLPYDAVIVLGATDLEELGEVFTKYADFFYNTPLINIDHRAANEHFGAVNLVDITTGSCAEVVYDFVVSRNPGLITPDVATALYAGIVAGTDSFQKPSTTPRSFQVAADLIEYEADRPLVIQHLVKTKPLKLIKLLGSVYAHLRYEEQVKLYWTILERKDFLENKASSKDIPATMYELANNIAGFNAAFLLYEDPSESFGKTDGEDKEFHVYVLLGRGLKTRQKEIQEVLSAKKENGALVFDIAAASIEAAERKAHERIREILP